MPARYRTGIINYALCMTSWSYITLEVLQGTYVYVCVFVHN